MIRVLITVCLLCNMLSMSIAQDYKATLIGYNQPRPIITNGIGVIEANFDGEFLRISGFVEKLEGQFGNDIHDGATLYQGVSGTIGTKVADLLAFVNNDGHGFVLDEVANRFTLTDEQIEALNNNELYINVPTDKFPNGEIRAQIIPEEAVEYHCLMLASGLTHPVPSRGMGQMLITLVGDTVTVSGSFRDLEGNLDLTQNGGATLRSEYAGTDGAILDELVVTADTLANAGIVYATGNKTVLTLTQKENLKDGGIYVEAYSDHLDRAEIRGQATPPIKQLYMANLRSYNTIPFHNSRATGKILVERNHGDSLRLSGSFHDLEGPLATDFAGGALLYNGLQGREGTVKEILEPELILGETAGKFRSTEHFYDYLPQDIEKLDNREYYVVMHSEAHFDGEVRGQILPIGQNYFSVVMNDLQTGKGNLSGQKAYIDGVQLFDTIDFSGAALAEDVTIANANIEYGLAGTYGEELRPLILDTVDGGNNVLSAVDNVFIIEDSFLDTLINREAYIHFTDDEGESIIRGQILPTFQSLYVTPLSDRQSIQHVESKGKGILLVEQINDSEIIITGSIDSLSSNLIDDNIFNSVTLSSAAYGSLGTGIIDINPIIGTDLRSASFSKEDNRYNLQQSVYTAMQQNLLHVVTRTEDYPAGEIRGQVLELADAYYNSRISAANVINSSNSQGSGLAMLVRKNDIVTVAGSLEGLETGVDFSNNGGVSIRNAAIDENGPIKFILFPNYDQNTQSGVIEAEENTLFLEQNDVDVLDDKLYYLEVRRLELQSPALRGHILPFHSKPVCRPEVLAPINRDTILIDGLVTDQLQFDIVDDTLMNTVAIQISDRPDFEPILYGYNFGFNDDFSLSYDIIDSLLSSQNQIQGDTFRFYYRVIRSDGADIAFSDVRSINAIKGVVTGIPDFYRAHLSANHETPPSQSTGYGYITGELIDNQLRISGSISNLMSPIDTMLTGGMHLHIGVAGRNGPVVFPLVPQISSDGLSAILSTSGNTFTLSETILDTLNKRSLYINVHTVNHPNGELRGQLLPDADQYFYTNLLSSNADSRLDSEAFGALSLELRGDQLTATGSFNDLTTAFNDEGVGGSSITLSIPGVSGPQLFSFTPTLENEFNGVYLAEENILTLSTTDLSLLESRNLQAEILDVNNVDHMIQGVITPIVKGVYRTHLNGLHHRDRTDSDAYGVVQVDIDVDNNVGVYGSYSNLVGISSDFNGDMIYGEDIADTLTTLLQLNTVYTEVDSTAGLFYYDNNNINLTDSQASSLIYRQHFIALNQATGIGGVRGQVQGLAQSYGYAIMDGYQSIPASGGGELHTIFTERTGSEMLFTGKLGSAMDSIIISEGVAGQTGNFITSINPTELDGYPVINPYANRWQVSNTHDSLFNNRSINLATIDAQDRAVRGQLVPEGRHIYFAKARGTALLPSINTDAQGYLLMESTFDNKLIFSGSVSNLEGDLQTSGLRIIESLPGKNGAINYIPNLDTSNGDILIFANDNTIEEDNDLRNLASQASLAVIVESDVYPSGELKGQLRPIANYHYTSTLNAAHDIDYNESNALGKVNLDVAGNRLNISGSYAGLESLLTLDPQLAPTFIAYNKVFDPLNPAFDLLHNPITATDGEWRYRELEYKLTDEFLSSMLQGEVHIAVNTMSENPEIRGTLLDQINEAPIGLAIAIIPIADTIQLEDNSVDVLSINFTSALDANTLMYKYQVATDANFIDIVYEKNAEDQLSLDILYGDLYDELSENGIPLEDTIQLFQRIYVTDGSEDAVSPMSTLSVNLLEPEIPVDLFRCYLSGYQEVSPVLSRGQGDLNLTLQDNILTVGGTISNLESLIDINNAGGAHIRFGLAGEQGSIIQELILNVSTDGRSATLNPSNNTFGLTPNEVQSIRSRSAYINVFSLDHTQGEIRGQVLPADGVYYLANMTDSQLTQPTYHLNSGAIVIERNQNNITVSGSIQHSVDADTEYALYLGAVGEDGQKIMNLNPSFATNGMSSRFLPELNTFSLSAQVANSLEQREVYIQASNPMPSISDMRGQVLPELRSAAFVNLSSLKTSPSRNTFAEGKLIIELSKNDEISISGTASKLQEDVASVVIGTGLPGQQGNLFQTLVPVVGSDSKSFRLDAAQNTINLSVDELQDLIDREYYIQVNTNTLTSAELKGQILALAPMYAEAIVSGSQVVRDASNRSSGVIEAEVYDDYMLAVGSITNLPNDVTNLQLINATLGLDGALISQLNYVDVSSQEIEIRAVENINTTNLLFAGYLRNNQISIRVLSNESTNTISRGLLIPPAQALYTAILGSASLVDRTRNTGVGIATVILRNDNEIQFATGVDFIPTQSLQFLLGNGLPGTIDNNPSDFGSFENHPLGGAVFNTGDILTLTNGNIDALTSGRLHVVVARDDSEELTEFLRGQILDISDQGFQATFTPYHPVGATSSQILGKLKASIIGNQLYILGSHDDTSNEITEAYIGLGDIYSDDGELYPLDFNSNEIPLQSFDLLDGDIDALLDSRLHVTLVTSDFENGAVRAQLLPEVNYYPSSLPIDNPTSGTSLTIAGSNNDVLSVDWTEIESPDDLKYIWELSDNISFEDPLLRLDNGPDDNLTVTFGVLDTLLTQELGLSINQSTTLYHRLVISDGSEDTYGQISTISLRAGVVVGVKDYVLSGIDKAKLAPNLSYQGQTKLHLSLTVAKNLELRIISNDGAVVYNRALGYVPNGNQEFEIDVPLLLSGEYQVIITDGQDIMALPWMVIR